MIKEKLGQHLDGWIHTAFPFLFQRPIDPNALTAVGTVVSLGAAWAFAEGALVTGALVMLAGGFFDLVDGVVARHFGTSTRFGAFFDSTMDRVADVALFAGLVIHYSRVGEGVPLVLATVALTSTVVTSYAKARAELVIPRLEGGMLERGERFGILAAGALFGWMEPALWVLAVGTTWTAGQRIAGAYRAMQELDAHEANEGRPHLVAVPETGPEPGPSSTDPDSVENA